MIKVCLNAGHKPGMDPGAIGIKSTEADLALKFATKAAEYLRAVGYNVLVVQENELEDIACLTQRNERRNKGDSHRESGAQHELALICTLFIGKMTDNRVGNRVPYDRYEADR